MEFISVGDKAFYLAAQDPAHTRVIPVNGPPSSEFDRASLLEIVTKAGQPTGLSAARFITAYDAHYLDRHNELPLPVLFVRLKDPQRSAFYIDPRTARITGSYSSGRWPERWLYHGLHSINLPWLYNHRPAWDVAVLFLMLGGTSLIGDVCRYRQALSAPALTSAACGTTAVRILHNDGAAWVLMANSSVLRRCDHLTFSDEHAGHFDDQSASL